MEALERARRTAYAGTPDAGGRDRLNVLLIGAYCPFPPRSGWATRTYQLARQLAARHAVTLLCCASPEEESALRELPADIDVEVVVREQPAVLGKRWKQLRSTLSPVPALCFDAQTAAMQAAINRLSSARRFDVVQVESTLVWGFRMPPGAMIVIDEHNVDFEVYARMAELARNPARRAFYRVQQAKFRRYEVDAWRSAAGCAVTSERELEMIRALAPDTAAEVVPNGVDVDYFAPADDDVAPRTLVFNGVLDYRPNVDAVEFMLQDILPLVRQRHPDLRLQVVGRGAAEELERLRRAGAEVTGEVPDVRPHLRRAAVVVVPIRMGSGTRFKVVEGLSMARPMVSTAVGCEGIDVRDGEHLVIADRAEDFAAGIVKLLDDPPLGARLGAAGRQLIERRYSWDYAGARLDDLYRMARTARTAA